MAPPRHVVGWLALVLGAGGCDTAHEDAPPSPTVATVEAEAPSPWLAVGETEVMTIAESELDEAFAAAVARARASVDEARSRWSKAPEAERHRWAVKWSAPTTDGLQEHVWVEPLHWSRFRVEGRLASPPQRELLSGRTLDELVSFAAEEIVDWVRLPDELGLEPREGGFTIDALEATSTSAPSRTEDARR